MGGTGGDVNREEWCPDVHETMSFFHASSSVVHFLTIFQISLTFHLCFTASTLGETSPPSQPLSVSASFQDRWGEQDYSSFSPRWLLIHQGHSCVWIMSELRSKYLSMTSCLDWCSCAIWFFMYHGQDSWTAVALQEKGCPASAPETLRRKRRLSGLARTCKAAQNVTLTLSCSDEMPGWGNRSDMLYIFKNRPFRNLNQFRGNVTRRLKAGDWYHVNPAKLYTSITRLRLNLTPT